MRHRPIFLSTRKSFNLYFARFFQSCLSTKCFNCISGENIRLIRLLEKTSDRIEESFDIIKLIKNLRELKILSNNSNAMNPMTKF